MIVRPVRSADLSALIDLARSTGTGLTTLPANEERLSHRVGWADKTFRGEAERADADYLFVMEDDDGKVVGISAVAGAVGLREPWYNYRVGLTVSASQELKIHREIPTLFLANDLTGNSELCSLFLHAGYRRAQRPPAVQGAFPVHGRVPRAVRQQGDRRDARHVRREWSFAVLGEPGSALLQDGIQPG